MAAAALYVRCTAVDPSDRTEAKKDKRKRQLARGSGTARLPRLRYGFILWRYMVRVLRRVETRVTNRWVRRSYMEQWNTSVQLDPMLPSPSPASTTSSHPARWPTATTSPSAPSATARYWLLFFPSALVAILLCSFNKNVKATTIVPHLVRWGWIIL